MKKQKLALFIKIISSVLFFALLIYSCVDDNDDKGVLVQNPIIKPIPEPIPEPNNCIIPDNLNFTDHISGIVKNKCASCHSTTSIIFKENNADDFRIRGVYDVINKVIEHRDNKGNRDAIDLGLNTCEITTINKWLEKVGIIEPVPIPEPTCNLPDKLTYTDYIAPIINNNCIGCHSSDNGPSPQIRNRRDFDSAADRIKFIINNPQEHKNFEAPFNIIGLGLTKCVVSNMNRWFEKGDVDYPACRDKASFKNDILPVIVKKCSLCHSEQTSGERGNNISLHNYGSVYQQSLGCYIPPQGPLGECSPLYSSIVGAGSSEPMPPSCPNDDGFYCPTPGFKHPEYTNCEKASLDQWFRNGIPND